MQSDIWSLGLSLVEMALGAYPYPTDKFDSVFAQLNAIVMGEPPALPQGLYSDNCVDFVGRWYVFVILVYIPFRPNSV